MKKSGLVLCVLLAACGADGGDQLIGTWDCDFNQTGVSMQGDTTYAKGGRTSATFDMTMMDSGAEIKMSGTMSGTWELEGDQLTETADNATIVVVTVDGQPVEEPALIDRFERSMSGQVSTSEVKVLDDDSLIVDMSDGTVSCDRK